MSEAEAICRARGYDPDQIIFYKRRLGVGYIGRRARDWVARWLAEEKREEHRCHNGFGDVPRA